MNGYEEYFKKRKQVLKGHSRRSFRQKASPFWLVGIAFVLAGGCVWYLFFGGEKETATLMNKVSVSVIGEAVADDGSDSAAAEENSAASDSKSEANKSTDGAPAVAKAKSGPKTWTDEEITLFTKLEARKKQLDAREAALDKLEEELQKQKDELEKKLDQLEQVRGQISEKLEDKVKLDEEKIEALVSVYSNMKPAQAAQIIAGLNDELAVEVLGKMKNKAAADILNQMDATRAEHLSEKFAGFREPSSAPKGTMPPANATANGG